MSHPAEIEVRHPRSTSSYTPGTFAERGVAVPFTTPLLGGARVRTGDREAPELVVHNPTGGRGVYIVPWAGVPAICTPTLHDRVLYERLCALPALTPAAVRQAAADVARQGLAGRAAAAAAAAAQETQARLVAGARTELLLGLLGQPSPPAAAPPEAVAERALVAVAARLGRSLPALSSHLDGLAAALAPLGLGAAAAEARLPARLRAMEAMQAGLRASLAEPSAPPNPDADLVLRAAEAMSNAARTLREALLQPLRDVPALLRSWLREPETTLRLARPDWLLDGWDWLCLLWEEAGDGGDRLLGELADLVPALPREAGEWVGGLAESAAGVMRGRRGQDVRPEDWRSGPHVADRILRNERLRARAMARFP